MYALAIPKDLAAGSYKVRASFAGTAGEKLAAVEVVAEAALALMEADKAMYKPGQTAKFRVLVVKVGDLRPIAGRQVRFDVKAPNGFKLIQVENPTDSAGVAKFEFPIADEPILGEHLARATVVGAFGDGAVHETGFTVEEYVLPRFEVNISCDQDFLTSSWDDREGTATVTGKVGATYTFGKSVAGKVTITLLSKMSGGGAIGKGVAGMGMAPPGDVGGGGGVPYRALATTEVHMQEARISFTLPVQKADLNAGMELILEASVTDSATGEVQNATTSLPVVYKGSDLNVHLELADGGEVFKPGLPAAVRVKVSQPGGGVPDRSVLGAGVLKLVMQRMLVSYAVKAPDPVKVTLDPASFMNGVVPQVDMSIVPDDSGCCDPLASVASRTEYEEKMGCCTSRVEFHVERDGSRLWGSSGEGGETPTLCTSRAYSPTGHYLAVSAPPNGQTSVSIEVKSTIAFSDLKPTADYFVMHGGALSRGGTGTFVTGAASGDGYWKATLPIEIPAATAGTVKVAIVARLATGGAVVTGSSKWEKAVTWPFALSASFSAAEVKPGDTLDVDISASNLASGEAVHVFVTSLDRSAELLGRRATIDGQAVVGGLARSAGTDDSVAPRVWRHCQFHGIDVPILGELSDGLALLVSSGTDGKLADDTTMDEPFGPSLGANCPRPISSGCSSAGGGDVMMMEAAMAPAADGMQQKASAADAQAAGSGSGGGESRSVAVRKFFPETWMWTDYDLTTSLTSANSRLSVTAPDTITTWSLEAFATTPSGFAAIRAVDPLKVFKPFFVEARLPYSAMRGEELEVILAVYNYAEGTGSVEASVSIVLPPSLELVGGTLASTVNVTEGSASRVSVRVKPTSLGTATFSVVASAPVSGGLRLEDAIEKPLHVKPEGFEVRTTKNVVLELSADNPTGSAAIELAVPANVVDGSAWSTVSVVGDLLGPTISGLERLLRIPTGCGEQNMITLAPNVYVGKYLTSVGRLRPDLQQRIVRNMLVGYGRELTYRHPDGSFSAFGSQDQEGSTWLTAFVLKTFAEVQALGLISVDTSVLASAATWLVQQQAADGSFLGRGQVIHQEMMGGMSSGSSSPPMRNKDGQSTSTSTSASSESSLSAYVLSALAKTKSVVPNLAVSGLDAALTKAGSYLASMEASKKYTKLLRIFALHAAGLKADEVAASECLALSEVDAGGSLRFWSGDSSSSQDIELTGYGVLVLSLAGKLSEALQGTRWLLARRKKEGGFESTQDTVIALGALATYATAVAGSVTMSVKLTSDSGLDSTLKVDDSNIDVLQSITLPWPSSLVNISANGSGTGLVVSELVYNVPEAPIKPCYDIEVRWFEFSATSAAVRGCVTPLPDCTTASDGMWLLSLGMFTGYSPSASSLANRLKGGGRQAFRDWGHQG
mmetsp:Transcript_58504/g.189512  ORF Transcript_58504/g.189512 Transcript_58504/m.189512 type:complete len:1401 (+) Transcript_58504:208-4410(+)